MGGGHPGSQLEPCPRAPSIGAEGVKPQNEETIVKKLLARVLSMIMAASLAAPAFAASSQGQNRIRLYLDGTSIFDSVIGADEAPPEIKDGRTMVPIRALAEKLGADVGWDAAMRQVTLVRAGVTIVMTVDSKTAYVNGRAVEMDVAPYITNGRTLIPARYVGEFFGQKVEWDGEKRQVVVTEDKSAVGNSNLEAWALPMGSMLAYLNQGDYRVFGLYKRAHSTILPATGGIAPPGGGDFEMVLPCERCRLTLSESWDINSREELIYTVCSMTLYGHNEDFLAEAADAGADAATRRISTRWGDRGILCWDLFRMSDLVQWGYVAGYVTYPEALALLEPAATLLCENFSSWDEAYENYLDGYIWWSGIDAKDAWDTGRGVNYKAMSGSAIFDDTLFETGVIPVPGVTAAELLQSVLED